jgi:uncharacterized protein
LVDYLDTSGFIKLVRSEPESPALREALSASEAIVSSALLVVEGHRAAARYGAAALARARAGTAAITLLAIDEATLDAAATLDPPELRSLDAIHLATAVGLGPDLARFYCYDSRLAQAAIAHGLDVERPT